MKIVISHPRFYWGEVGNVHTPALFELPIPASRAAVKTGYDFVLPDQNGWSRSLHFQTAWIAVFTGLLYVVFGFLSGHFRKSILPHRTQLSWSAISGTIANHLRFKLSGESEGSSYNVLQRLAYTAVIFVLFPLMIWTGLAMSPAVNSVIPGLVSVLGGQQSARTIHFLVTIILVLFVLIHLVMIAIAGFGHRTQAMITGRASTQKEHSR